MINIKSQGFISELGKRTNNEDNSGMRPGHEYVVCDGVGGAEKGEIASEIVVRTFINTFNSNPNANVEDVLSISEQKISSYLQEHPGSDGMATTLTFSHIRSDGILIAWVGDSRIYQFRDGRILFKTTDHSWVNEALQAGIITKEEAVNHPKSNVITRAVQGAHKPVKADVRLLTDIREGDYFLHCSDGVLESWEDEDLCALFSLRKNPDELLTKLKEECAVKSKDNFTAIIYEIGAVKLKAAAKKKTNLEVDGIFYDGKKDSLSSDGSSGSLSSILSVFRVKIFKVPLLLVVFVAIAAVVVWSMFLNPGNNKSPKEDQIPGIVTPNRLNIQEDSQNEMSIFSDSLKGISDSIEDLGEKIKKLDKKKDSVEVDSLGKRVTDLEKKKEKIETTIKLLKEKQKATPGDREKVQSEKEKEQSESED